MTTQAVGTYLYLVRDVVRRLPIGEVAAKIAAATGMPMTALDVRRIERGEPTTVAILYAFVDAIDANMQDATTLLHAETPTDEMIGAMVRQIRIRYASSQPVIHRMN